MFLGSDLHFQQGFASINTANEIFKEFENLEFETLHQTRKHHYSYDFKSSSVRLPRDDEPHLTEFSRLTIIKNRIVENFRILLWNACNLKKG